MIILIIYAFLAGFVTILSPCILPLLPIILANSLHPNSKKPLGIIIGFVLSFTFFTLFLSSIVKSIGVSADSLRNLSIFILFGFGAIMLFDKVNEKIEFFTSSLIGRLPRVQNQESLSSGILIGLSLGLLWTPCVGPILASVISLSFSGVVTGSSIFVTLAYAMGTAIPMLFIMKTGSLIFQKIPSLRSNLPKIQKVFALIMMLTALALFFGFDRNFQTSILNFFPSYGSNLTKIESSEAVKSALEQLNKSQTIQVPSTNIAKPSQNLAPELVLGGQWINSAPLKLTELRGKVVLIDFWTYTCINCIRTLPYLKSWHQKYEKNGLVIIGVHSPEFEFEKNLTNVQKAVKDFDLKYPIMQDNDFATWRAFHNQYWPAKYLINKDGEIVYTHFGEGEYDATEQKIQELLSKNSVPISEKIANPSYDISSKTPEIYLGAQRADHYDSLLRLQAGLRTFELKSKVNPNTFSFSGTWQVEKEMSRSVSKGASILLNFHASKVHLVLSSPNSVGTVKVYLDGELVDNAQAGVDAKNSEIIVTEARKYDVINLPQSGKHLLKLEFSPDIEAYAFTFG